MNSVVVNCRRTNYSSCHFKIVNIVDNTNIPTYRAFNEMLKNFHKFFNNQNEGKTIFDQIKKLFNRNYNTDRK